MTIDEDNAKRRVLAYLSSMLAAPLIASALYVPFIFAAEISGVIQVISHFPHPGCIHLCVVVK